MYGETAPLMRKLIPLLAILFCAAAFVPPAVGRNTERPAVPAKIMQAYSVYVDCVCPRGLAAARETALQQLRRWGRFQISDNRRQTDLVFLFSGNPYLGDYITRDGPDERPVVVDFTIMTVIDPHTGQTLWTDSRRWGSWRVSSATKDLIDELRAQIEGQTTKWTLNDILMCGVAPVYAGFAHLTQEQVLAKSDSGPRKITRTPDHLLLTSVDAPAFCKRAEFLFGPERQIAGFAVVASRADDLDVNEVLQRADRFDFNGGKYANGDQVYFTAKSKDGKILIQFEVDNQRLVLARVSYFY
jgi:hypothetical protein